jgi:glycosyltransferase involved in cell wall biosynthesis
MKKVGFIFTDGVASWNGGMNYYSNLFHILKESEMYTPIIFTSPDVSNVFRQKFPDIQVIDCKAVTGKYIKAFIRKIFYYSIGRNFFLDSFLKKENIDVVSHNELPLDIKSDIPSCGWIPDFQCIHYPEFFTKKNIKRNKYNYKYLEKTSTRIVVSSVDCKKDLLSLLPKSDTKKITVFHFCLPPIAEKKEYDVDDIAPYNIEPYKYFIVSNQFWQHKNHIIILKALKKLLENLKNLPFKIVATGLLNDPRDPKATIMLKNYIKENNLNRYFYTTGMIPYKDVLTLQNYSMAVIQPSLFEGWNTAVEECKRIGKKIILSNIRVHIEQKPDNVIYFDPHNDTELAEIFMRIYKEYDTKKENAFEKLAYTDQKNNWGKFSEEYIELLEKTITEGAKK